MTATIHPISKAPMFKMCNRKGCIAHAAGMLRMNIPPARETDVKDAPPLQLPVPLLLCAEHAAEAKAQDFQTPAWREEVRKVLAKRGAKAVPDFENAWLDVVPFGSGAELVEEQSGVLHP